MATKKTTKKPAAKKTAKKPAAKKVAKKPAAKKTAKKKATATAKPAAKKKVTTKKVAKTATKKPVAKKTTTTKKVAKKKATAKKVAKKATTKKVAKNATQKLTKKKAVKNGVNVVGTRHEPPVYLLVHLPVGLSLEERTSRFEFPLDVALGQHGTITGGGTTLGDDEEPVSCDLEIEVYDVAHALPLIRRVLVEEKAPDGTLVTRLSKKGEFEVLFMIGD